MTTKRNGRVVKDWIGQFLNKDMWTFVSNINISLLLSNYYTFVVEGCIFVLHQHKNTQHDDFTYYSISLVKGEMNC